MPANLDDAGDNPFFMGYHEGPTMGKTRFPSISAKIPMDSVQWTIRRYFPGVTPYLKDWIWKELEQKGIMEQAGKDGFEDKVQSFMEEFLKTNHLVVDGHLSKIGDTNENRESHK